MDLFAAQILLHSPCCCFAYSLSLSLSHAHLYTHEAHWGQLFLDYHQQFLTVTLTLVMPLCPFTPMGWLKPLKSHLASPKAHFVGTDKPKDWFVNAWVVTSTVT